MSKRTSIILIVTIFSFVSTLVYSQQNDNLLRICSRIQSTINIISKRNDKSIGIDQHLNIINASFDSLTTRIQNCKRTISSEYDSSLSVILSSLLSLKEEKDSIKIFTNLLYIEKDLNLKNVQNKKFQVGEGINSDINVIIRLIKNGTDANGYTVQFSPALFPNNLKPFPNETSPTMRLLQPGIYIFIISKDNSIIKTKEDEEVGYSGNDDETFTFNIDQ